MPEPHSNSSIKLKKLREVCRKRDARNNRGRVLEKKRKQKNSRTRRGEKNLKKWTGPGRSAT